MTTRFLRQTTISLRVLLLWCLLFVTAAWSTARAVTYFRTTASFFVNLRNYTSIEGGKYIYRTLRYSGSSEYGIVATGASEITDPNYWIEVEGGVLTKGAGVYDDRMAFPSGGTITVHFKPATTLNEDGISLDELCMSSVRVFDHNQDDGDPIFGYSGTYFNASNPSAAVFPGILQTGTFVANVPAGYIIKAKRYSVFGSGISLCDGIDFFMGKPAKIDINSEPEGRKVTYSGKAQQLVYATSYPFDYGDINDGGADYSILTYAKYMYRITKFNNTSYDDEDHWETYTGHAADWVDYKPTATKYGKYQVEWYVQTSTVGRYGEPGRNAATHPCVITYVMRTINDSINPKALDLTYNFRPQELVTKGITAQGTYHYRLGELGEWTTEVPKATDAGDYTVYYYIEGDGSAFYDNAGSEAEPYSVDVTIKKFDLAAATVDVTENLYTYDGHSHRAQLKVTYGLNTISNLNYDITYQLTDGSDEPTASKTANGNYNIIITATERDNFTGRQVCAARLVIGKFDLANAFGEIGTHLYTGSQLKPALPLLKMKATDDDADAISTEEFSYDYGENLNAGRGSGTVTVTANADSKNYQGTRVITFDINPRKVIVTAGAQTIPFNDETSFKVSGDANDATLSVNTSAIYTEVNAAEPFSLDGVTLQSVSFGSPDVLSNVGSYNTIYPANATLYKDGADVTANYDITYATGTLTITGKTYTDGGDITVGNLGEYPYTGDPVEPAPKVRDKGMPLASTDYTLSYDTDHSSVGVHTVTVNFQNNYSGTASATYEVYYALPATNEHSGTTDYYRTYYNGSEDLEIRDNTKFHAYKGAVSGNTVVLTDVGTVIPATNAVMLVGSETPIRLYKKSDSSTSGDFSGNELQGGSGTASSSNHYYIFDGDMFIWAVSGEMASDKAYIPGPVFGATASSPARLTIVFGDDETTGLNEELRMKDEASDRWYDLRGNRIERPTRKGLYIHNGRKEVVR